MYWEADVEERLRPFADGVRRDVDAYLASTLKADLSDLTWTFVVPFEDAMISVGVNGYGTMAKVVDRQTEHSSHDLDLATRRVAFMVFQRVMPILLRLTPRPPFIPGDPPSEMNSHGSKEK